MFRNRFFFVCFVMGLMVFGRVTAYVTQAVELAHEKTNVHVYGCGIIHSSPENVITLQHRSVVQEYLKGLSEHEDVLCIAEDPMGYVGNDPIIQQEMDLIPVYSSQHRLSVLCKQRRIPFFNAEYRFARIASIPLLLSFERLLQERECFFGNYPDIYSMQVSAQSLAEEVRYSADQLMQWQDKPVVDYYHDVRAQAMRPIEQSLAIFSHFNGTVGECVAQHVPQKKRLPFLDSLYVDWGLAVLDAHVIHRIAQARNKKVFVCVGNGHLAHIVPILKEKLGFKQKSHIGTHEFVPYPDPETLTFDPERLPDRDVFVRMQQEQPKLNRPPLESEDVKAFLTGVRT